MKASPGELVASAATPWLARMHALSAFRRADVSRVVALVTAVSQAGYAFAPFVFALVASSGTAWLFASAAGLQVAAAATLVLMRPRPMAALPVAAAP